MTELAKSLSTYSAVAQAKGGYTESIANMTAELETQISELDPVIEFYDRLVRGWHGRILRAESALKNPLNESEVQQKVFFELRNVAKVNLEKYLPAFNELKTIKAEIEARIAEFDLMHFVANTPENFSATISDMDSFKQTKELLHRADALIELRKEG